MGGRESTQEKTDGTSWAEDLSLEQKKNSQNVRTEKNFRGNYLVNLLMLQVRKIGSRETTDQKSQLMAGLGPEVESKNTHYLPPFPKYASRC